MTADNHLDGMENRADDQQQAVKAYEHAADALRNGDLSPVDGRRRSDNADRQPEHESHHRVGCLHKSDNQWFDRHYRARHTSRKWVCCHSHE